MNSRSVLGLVFVVLGVLSGWAVCRQHRQLVELRAGREQSLAGSGSATEVDPGGGTNAERAAAANPAGGGELYELLRLRNQVSQLRQRKSELSGAALENEQLRTELAARGTNQTSLPPGYLRRSEANWVGLGRPEDTLQSFLWAIRNRDDARLREVLTPETVEDYLRRNGGSLDEFFTASAVLPGMHLLEQRQTPTGGIEAQVEIIPGEPLPEPIRFQPTNGGWRLDIRGL
jgi:hypothetical protein